MERRVALVTGSSRGIGKAIAIELGRLGFSVIVNCRQRMDLAEQTADVICANGGRADFFCADVSNIDDVKKMYDFACKNYGFVDTIINNAGISHYNLFTDDNDKDYDRVIGTNLRGTYNLCKAFVPNMIYHKFGRIVNVSSIWGQVGASCETLYSMSKAGVIGLTKALAKELAPSGITVNAVAPGVIDTDMLKDIDKSTIEALVSETPLGRIGKPSDVAAVVTSLLSEESFINGQVINISGGFIIT